MSRAITHTAGRLAAMSRRVTPRCRLSRTSRIVAVAGLGLTGFATMVRELATGVLVLWPATMLVASLLQGRYVGEEALVRLAAALRPASRRRARPAERAARTPRSGCGDPPDARYRPGWSRPRPPVGQGIRFESGADAQR